MTVGYRPNPFTEKKFKMPLHRLNKNTLTSLIIRKTATIIKENLFFRNLLH